MNFKRLIARPLKFKTTRGFSLLEAIVALALISLTGTAIFSWINQSLSNLSRLNNHQAQTIQLDNALAYLRQVNPMATPQGSVVMGDTQLNWSSELIEPQKRMVGRRGTPTPYVMGLYSMTVEVRRPDAKPLSFNIRQVGYQDAR